MDKSLARVSSTALISRIRLVNMLILAILAAGLFPFPANAEVIVYQQPLRTFTVLDHSSNSAVFSLTGTSSLGISASTSQARFWARSVNNDGTYAFSLRSYSSSNYMSGEQIHVNIPNGIPVSDATGGAEVIVDFPEVALDANRFYRVIIGQGGGFSGNMQVFGIDSPSNCHPSFCTGTPYFYLLGSTTPIVDNEGDFTQSYIIRVNSPLQSEVTASTQVTFDFDYWNTGFQGFDKAGIALSNLTAGQTVVVPESDILSSGEGSYENSATLIEDNAYMYRPYLRNSSTNQRIYGQTIIFHVVENVGGQSLIPDVTEENATSTVQGIFGNAFGILNLFEGRFPFNWFFEVGAILQTLDDSEEEQAELTLNFASSSPEVHQLLGGQEITLFSEETVSHFMPDGFLAGLHLFISAVLYIGLATNIFFTVKNLYA